MSSPPKLAAGLSRAMLLLALGLATVMPAMAQDGPPEARLLRFPDIHKDFVVFVYAGDIWRAPTAGGEARRLTAHEGQELFPKISRDGKWIAFSAEYSGTRQIYVMPSVGGAPKQLTYYTDVGPMPPRGGFDNWIQHWTSDGKILVRMNRTPWGVRMGRYFLVDPEGGLETPLELPEGGGASLSPDGKALAYTPISREFRTWKRTRGGRAQDVWIYHFDEQRSERLTTDRGTDNFPLWHGRTIYLTSDREDTLNLYAYDLDSKALDQVTDFETFDVLWPSLGPESIVFMNGGYLHRFDLASGESRKIPIHIGTDLPHSVARFEDVSDDIDDQDVSPSGARAVFAARGDLFTVPAEKGPTRNLTRSQGVRERAPSWSPDGRWIAYLSDATGEYEIYVRPQDGSGEARQLTQASSVWMDRLVWSPDSKKIAFGDQDRRLRILDVDSGELTDVARGTMGAIGNYSWSPDGRWLAYDTNGSNRLQAIGLYSLDSGKAQLLGDGLTNDYGVSFAPDGKYLYFISDRDYRITFSSFEFNYLYNRSGRVYAVALNPEAPALFPQESDEEQGEPEAMEGSETEEEDTKKGKKGKKGDKKDDAPAEGDEGPEPTVVQADGFVSRTISLPGIPASNYFFVVAVEGGLLYARAENGPLALYRYDLKDREEKEILGGIQSISFTADGSKLLYQARGSWGIVDAKGSSKPGDGSLDLDGLRMKIDPKAEWRQMFEDGWRITRDWFYDRNMHGYDWKALGERYREMVPHVSHRAELDFIFGELIGELEAGHTYVTTGDEPRVERVPGGMLGCELELDPESDRFRIARIFPGENWDSAYRSPLTEPGVGAKEGEYLLAIDGEALRHPDNPYRLLEGKANQVVTLTLGPNASSVDSREVMVRPITAEGNLRYLEWVKERMALTDRLSDGRIGYIHLPNTAIGGNRMLQKLFYSQAAKEALIIDDRYNGGGFIPDRMIEMLARTDMAYWARRDVESMRTPGFAHRGPKAMLVNGYSSSGGDALPYFFRQEGLGKIIGTRTWGGLIGLSGAPSLVDGGGVLPPTFRIYDESGEWVVENEGVTPDIEVFDLPEAIIQGKDPSLEKGIEVLLDELEQGDFSRPTAPEPPDLSPN